MFALGSINDGYIRCCQSIEWLSRLDEAYKITANAAVLSLKLPRDLSMLERRAIDQIVATNPDLNFWRNTRGTQEAEENLKG
jgi:hypothetical protein